MSIGKTIVSQMKMTETSPLLTAALAGLMGAGLAGCGTKEKEKIVLVEAPSSAAAAAAVTSTIVDKTITLAKFSGDCDARGGLVQTHASCAGSNSCAGVSFHPSSGKLSEHSCKATNICAGMSCVDLAKDRGLAAPEILQGFSTSGTMVGSEVQCNFCHGEGKTSFDLPIAPNADESTAIAAFQAKSEASLVTTIAFGIHGVNANGTSFSNMPGFYQSYSLAEIKSLVTHLRSLPLEVHKWKDPQ